MQTIPSNPGDVSTLKSSCLRSLSASYHSLKHLRLSSVSPSQKNPADVDPFSSFKKARIFGVDLVSLVNLEIVEPPPGLEILQLPFYFGQESGSDTLFQEEPRLIRLLQLRKLPNLKEVFVPEDAIDSYGKIFASPQDRALWKQRRQALENLEIFKKGETKLRKVKPGEIGEYPSDWSLKLSLSRE